jgi:hypothetical protein
VRAGGGGAKLTILSYQLFVNCRPHRAMLSQHSSSGTMTAAPASSAALRNFVQTILQLGVARRPLASPSSDLPLAGRVSPAADGRRPPRGQRLHGLREPLLDSVNPTSAAAKGVCVTVARVYDDGNGGCGGGACARGGATAVGMAGVRLWVHAGIISLSGLLLGYDLCVIATVLTPVQRDLSLCPACTADATDAALAVCTCAAKQLAVSACHLGAMIGAALGGYVGDAIGRRATLLLTDLAFMVAALAMASADAGIRVALFYAGRALAGAALGAAGAVSSTYLAEIAPSSIRGVIVTCNELMLCCGCLLAYVAGTALGDAQWRLTSGLAGVGAAVQLCGVWCVLAHMMRCSTPAHMHTPRPT